MDEIINIKVNGNSITKDYNVAGTQFEANRGKLRITFSENWKGYGKSITFWNALGENPVKIQLGTDKLEDITTSDSVYIVPIPGEAMTEGGKCSFVIEGATDGVNARTVEDTLKVLYSPKADNAGQAVDPTPTQAEQLRQEIDGITEDIAEVKAVGEEVNAGLAKVDDAVAMAQSHAEQADLANMSAWNNAVLAGEAREAVENMTVSSDTLAPGEDATVEKSEVNGVAHLRFGIPKGNSGMHIGADEPTDEDVNVWIDTDAEATPYVTNLMNGEAIDSVVQHCTNPDPQEQQSVATFHSAVALGRYNKAKEYCSMAVNYNNEASGRYSFACGNANTASGGSSFVAGNVSKATGDVAVAMGLGSSATAKGSFAMGKNSMASGETSCAIGSGCTSSGKQSTAIGNYCTASADFAVAMGSRNEAVHRGSFAVGEYVKTTSNWSAAFGLNNDFSDETNIFTVGYGRNSSSRNNVFEINQKGIVRIKSTFASSASDEPSLMLGDTKITETQLKALLALIK